MEIGLEARFFDSKHAIGSSLLFTTVDNQIVTVRVSPASGYILQTRNEGNIKNHGIEMSVDQDLLKNKNLFWTATLNFGFNRGTVLSLPKTLSIAGKHNTEIFFQLLSDRFYHGYFRKDYLRQ
jgi:outer membrane receptor protein involved in Fe transport